MTDPGLPCPWDTPNASWLLTFGIFFFQWQIIALQYCVSFCHTSTQISHRYMGVPSLLNPPPTQTSPSRWSQSTEFEHPVSYSESHWLLILHMVGCVLPFYSFAQILCYPQGSPRFLCESSNQWVTQVYLKSESALLSHIVCVCLLPVFPDLMLVPLVHRLHLVWSYLLLYP